MHVGRRSTCLQKECFSTDTTTIRTNEDIGAHQHAGVGLQVHTYYAANFVNVHSVCIRMLYVS